VPAGSEARIETIRFVDDGLLPNSALLVILYRGAIEPSARDPAAAFERSFARNGWRNGWRDGVYPFHHYHSTSHEVLGIARGSAVLRLGGRKGRNFEVAAGDVVLLPAGTGHKRVSASSDFLVVGAYPDGRDWDLIKPYRESAEVHDEALARIAALPLPRLDPVEGGGGPVSRLWSAP
jgi:uncharacterized protein YjlB